MKQNYTTFFIRKAKLFLSFVKLKNVLSDVGMLFIFKSLSVPGIFNGRFVQFLIFFLFVTGSALAQTTTGSGNWSSTVPNAPWPGGVVPTAGANVTIAPGHTVTLDVNTANLTSLIINNTGTLTTTGAFTVTSTTINVNGLYSNGSSGAISFTTMSVDVAGVYDHAIDGGAVPSATWATTSTCRVTGVVSNAPTGFGQTFGDFIWNSSGQIANIYLAANMTIAGDFSVLSTGSLPLDPANKALRMSNTATGYTISVTGNVLVDNSTFKMNNSSGACTMNVTGNLTVNDANFTLSTGPANSTVTVTGNVDITGVNGDLLMQEDANPGATGILNANGNLSIGAGALVNETEVDGTGQINFIGAGTQVFTNSGSITNQIDFSVSAGSILQMAAATTTVTGTGIFSLAAGATLGVTSSAGITTSGATGNVQVTGTRTYAAGASYIYDGTGNQAVGNGLTQNIPADIQINNPGNIVTLGVPTSLTGNLTVTAGSLDTNGQTMTFNGSGAQKINSTSASQTFNDLVINKSGGTLSTGGSLTTLNVANLTQSAGDFTSPSTLAITGNLTFTAGIYTAGTSTNIGGNFISSGTFNNNGGTFTFNGSSPQTIAAETYNNLVNTGAGQKNGAGTIIVSNNLTNSSVFNMVGNTLSVSGSIANGLGDIRFSGPSNGLAVNTGIITYNGSSQTITAGTYNNLVVAQTGGEALLGGATSVNGTLSVNSRNLNLGGFVLTIGAAGSISIAAPSSTNMIIDGGGGEIRKTYTATGSFTFPLGDNSGALDYSPVTVNLTSAGGFSSAYIAASLEDIKHPNNSSSTHFITRYWQIRSSGITAPVMNVTGTYVNADINGVEVRASSAQLDGTFNQSSNPWVKDVPLGGNTLTYTGASLTDGQTSIFTGITGADPSISIDNGATQSLCQSTSVVLNTTLIGGDPTVTYSWSPTTDLSSSTIANPTYTGNTAGGPNTYTITATDANGITATDNIDITVNPKPVLDPNLDATVCSDVASGITLSDDGIAVAAATFNITAISNGGLTASAGAPVTGTGFASNEIIDDAWTNTGTVPVNVVYTVVPVSASGCLGDALNVTLTVNPEPVLSGGLDTSVCSDVASGIVLADNGSSVSAATFNITAINLNGLAASAGAPATGTGFGSNEIVDDAYTNQTMSPVNVVYTVVPVSASGCLGDALNVTLTVNPEPVLSSGLDASVCSDVASGITLSDDGIAVAAATFNITAINFNGLTASAGAPVTGTGFASNEIVDDAYTNQTMNPVNVVYTVVPVSASGCLGDALNVALTVNPEPVLDPNLDASVCSDVASGITLTSNGVSVAAATFNITAINLNGLTASAGAPVTGTGFGSNEIVDDAYTNQTMSPVNVVYTVVPVSASGCLGDALNVTLTVNPEPTAAASNQTICSGATTNVVISNPNSVPGTNYSWTVVSTNVTGASSGSGSVISQVLTSTSGNTQGMVDYTITPAASGCVGTPITITVTVDPVPDALATPSAETICSGQTSSIVLSNPNSVSGTTFAWTVAVSGGITGASSGSGNSINQALTNSNNTPGLATYTITPTAGGCSGLPITANVVVDPTPTIATSGDETICSANLTSITLSNPNSVPGTTYSWTVFSSTNVTGASGGSGTGIIQTLSSTNGINVGMVTYDITAFTGGCVGSSTMVTVTVNPDVNVNAGGDQFVCEGSNLVLGGSISGGVTTGAWSTSGDGIFDNTSFGVGTIYSPGPTDISSGTVVITLTADDSDGPGGPCPIRSDQFTLTINPIATVSVPANFAICEPAGIPVAGTIGGGATQGIWSVVVGNGTLSASSLTGSTVSASYAPDVSDVNTNIVLRLTALDPDGPSEPCTDIFADITITIDESAKVNAGPDISVCENAKGLLNATITGSVSTGTWTIVSGGDGFFDNPNSVVTNYNPGPNDKMNGATVVVRLTSADPGTTCGIVTDDAVVTVNKLPEVALTGLLPFYQEDAPPVTLVGFPTIGGTGVFSGPGVVGNQFFPTIAPLTPAVNTISYTFTSSSTGCTNVSTFDVTVNPVTTINFDLEDALGNLSVQTCGEVGLVRLVGSPDVTTGFPTTEFISTDPLIQSHIQINSGTGQYFLDTDGIPAGMYPITYTFTNVFAATTSFTKVISVFEAPSSNFSIGNFCIDSPILFTDLSTIPAGANIVSWDWNFGDNTISNAQNPSKVYTTEGTYNVSLTVTSDKGCTSTYTTLATFGAVPTVSFNATSFCNGDNTAFLGSVDWGTQIPSAITDYTWDFGDGNIVSSGTNNSTSHKYANFQVYNTQMTVTTTEGCQSSNNQPIAIFPFTTVNIVTEYREDFESGAGGWVPGADIASDTSWLLGTPGGALINSASSGVNAWWTGANGQTYFNGEQSYVNAPCFDITNLQRPMISMNIWNDTQEGFDGAVIQYSIDGGITWFNLGAVNKGVNWYNKTGILSKPGGDQNGWSGQTNPWVTARFNLDQIPITNRNQVRFRVAFGSNEDNPPGVSLDGFAFDDVVIRERDRLVLVENFTSLTNANYPQVRDQHASFAAQRPTDLVYLNYHIPQPAADSLQDDNKSEPQTRANSYGISQTINSVIDGNVYLGGALGWDLDSIDRRALVDPQFDISLQLPPTSPDSLVVQWDVTAADTVKNPIIVQTAVIEEKIVLAPGDTAFNVVKKLLPNAAGSSRSDLVSFNPGDTYSAAKLRWSIDVPIYDSTQLAVVVFVQQKTNGGQPGEVYQVAYKKVTDKKGSNVITGIEDVYKGVAEAIQVYPNPVENILNFRTFDRLSDRFNWRIVDQRGVELAADQFYFKNGQYSFDTNAIPNGIYYLIIGVDNTPLTYKKLVVVHR